jgi:enolase-phosphatase E1
VTVAIDAQAVVLDIEGTTTPIAFVHDVLFGFARTHLAAFLAQRGREPAIAEMLGALVEEFAVDRDPDRPAVFEVESYVRWLMDRDRKSTALKALQGEIWRGGYEAGELRSEIYDDVPPALSTWRDAGLAIAIYSSGSIDAQRLVFRHSNHGDLTPSIDWYFDTTTGPKRISASYARIAAELAVPPDRVVFVSDVGEELVACRDAGLIGVLSIRPGNAPVAAAIATEFPAITSFAQLAIRRAG